MSRRTRYQQGSVQRERRQSGSDVWIFRWRQTGPDGSGKQRKAIVGSRVSPLRQQLSKQLMRCASTQTNKPRSRKADRRQSPS